MGLSKWKNRKVFSVICVVVILLITLVWGLISNENIYNESQAGETKYRVIRVVDGDTIRVDFYGDNKLVRLIGIDAPESVHPDRTQNVPEGEIASEFLRNLLDNNYVRARV